MGDPRTPSDAPQDNVAIPPTLNSVGEELMTEPSAIEHAQKEAATLAGETQEQILAVVVDIRSRMNPTTERTPEAVEQRTNILLGEAALRNNRLDLARDFFKAAGVEVPADQLTEAADRLLAEGRLGAAQEAYKAARVTIAPQKLIDCGDYLLANGRLADAQKAYAAAGVEIPPDKLIDCGDRLLAASTRGAVTLVSVVDAAMTAYEAAGVELSAEKLVEFGDRLLAESLRDPGRETETWSRLNAAVGAYKAAQSHAQNYNFAREKLAEVGDHLLASDRLLEAAGVFHEAGVREKLIEVADRLAAKSDFFNARWVYRSAGVEMPAGQLMKFSDQLLAKGEIEKAREVLTKVAELGA